MKEEYIRIGSELIFVYKVPPPLCINIDETKVLFVNAAGKTRARIWAKRIRLIGVGNDKSCITTTLGIIEQFEQGHPSALPEDDYSEKVLGAQYIFAGKTDRTHPRRPPPHGSYFDHTPSHWQTPASFIRYLKQMIIPYKNKVITRLRLPIDQWMILKLDLHYSHFAPDVIKFMKENHIAPLFVPAACTDVLQECDLVMNKPFKMGVKSAFREYIHRCFDEYLLIPDNSPALFRPKLGMTELKPQMVKFVETGLAALKNLAFTACIAQAFAVNGCFAEMRSSARQTQASIAVNAKQVQVARLIQDVEMDDVDDVDAFTGFEDTLTWLNPLTEVADDESSDNSDSDRDNDTDDDDDNDDEDDNANNGNNNKHTGSNQTVVGYNPHAEEY